MLLLGDNTKYPISLTRKRLFVKPKIGTIAKKTKMLYNILYNKNRQEW